VSLDPQWVLAGSGLFGACGYIFKAVIWEMIREGRPQFSETKHTEGIPIRNKQLVNLVNLADVVDKLAEGQVKMMEAITRMAMILEERIPSRRR